MVFYRKDYNFQENLAVLRIRAKVLIRKREKTTNQ